MDLTNCVNNTNFPSTFATGENHRLGGIHFDEDNHRNNNINNYNININNTNYNSSNNTTNSNWSNNISINPNNNSCNNNLRRQTSDSNSYTPHVFSRLASTNTANPANTGHNSALKLPLSASVPSSSSAMKSMYQMAENSPVRPARLSGQEITGGFLLDNKSHENEISNNFHPHGPYWTSGGLGLGIGGGQGQGMGMGSGQGQGLGMGTGQGQGAMGGQVQGQGIGLGQGLGGGIRDNLLHNSRNSLSFQGNKSPLGLHKNIDNNSNIRSDLQNRENRDIPVGPLVFPNKKGEFPGKKVLTPRPYHGQSASSLYSDQRTRDITLSSSSSESKHSTVLSFTCEMRIEIDWITLYTRNEIITHLLAHTSAVTHTHTHPHTHTHIHTYTHTHNHTYNTHNTHTQSINIIHSNKAINSFITHSNSSPSGELSIVSEGSSAAYENRYIHTHVHTCHTPYCSTHTVLPYHIFMEPTYTYT